MEKYSRYGGYGIRSGAFGYIHFAVCGADWTGSDTSVWGIDAFYQSNFILFLFLQAH